MIRRHSHSTHAFRVHIPRAAALATALAALLSCPTAGHAQMAAALGKPLPDASMPDASASVRIIDGAFDKPLVGAEVKLVAADDKEFVARTDAEGRATFPKLPVGVELVARITKGERTTSSERFAVPSKGGVRLMLSASPLAISPADVGGAPGPMAGMPDPRQMSGVPRPERNDPAGRLTIRAVHGSMAANAVEQPIYLVAVRADGAVEVITKQTDVGGRASFDGLDTGSVAYYAMTVFTRPGGVRDRVMSEAIVLPPQVGIRLMLSGHTQDSKAPPIDDLSELVNQGAPKPPGTVVVRVGGLFQTAKSVELYRVNGPGEPMTQLAQAPVTASVPDPEGVTGSFAAPSADAAAAVGAVRIAIKQKTASAPQPIANARVELRPVAADAAAAAPSDGDTADDGAADVRTTDSSGVAAYTGLTPGARYRPSVVVHGKRIEGAPFAVPTEGGLAIEAEVTWQVYSQVEARFTDVPHEPGTILIAQTVVEGQAYRSPALPMTSDRGAATGIIIYPRVVTRFDLNGWVDDRYVGFQLQYTIRNESFAPYDPGPDGLEIPLPRGFVGAQVAEQFQHRVSVVPGRGLVWRGAVPPRGVSFVAGFSLDIEDGAIDVDMPLPQGTFQSRLIFAYEPGMNVELPGNTKGEVVTTDNGRRFYVVRNITIQPRHSMTFSITGLPQQSAVKVWLKRGVGAIVVLLLMWGLWGLFGRRGVAVGAASDAAMGRELERRREQLLDQLVELETRKRRGAVDRATYERDRTKLTSQLAAVYQKLAEAKGTSDATT